MVVVKTALSQKQIERSPLFFQRRAIAVELLFLINFQTLSCGSFSSNSHSYFMYCLSHHVLKHRTQQQKCIKIQSVTESMELVKLQNSKEVFFRDRISLGWGGCACVGTCTPARLSAPLQHADSKCTVCREQKVGYVVSQQSLTSGKYSSSLFHETV